MDGQEQKHLQGQHNQETHGRRVSANPVRLLLRDPDAAARRDTPRTPRRRTPLRATRSPAAAEAARRRERGLAQSPRKPRVVQMEEAPTSGPAPQLERQPDAPTPTPPVEKPIPRALGGLDDDELAELMVEAADRGDMDAVERITEELERRDESGDAWGSDEDARTFLDQISGQGRKSEREQAVEAYRDYAHSMWVRAMNDIGIHMVNHAGQRAKISDQDLFTGALKRSEVAKYATDDLLEWFARPGNQRMTQTEFVDEWLGKADRADRAKQQRPIGKEF